MEKKTKQEKLQAELERMVEKINAMSLEEKSEFAKKVKVRSKLIGAQLRDVEDRLESTNDLLNPYSRAHIERFEKILGISTVMGAILMGLSTGVSLYVKGEEQGIAAINTMLMTIGGSLYGLLMSTLVAKIDEAGLNVKKYCLTKRRNRLMSDRLENYELSKLTPKEEMGE